MNESRARIISLICLAIVVAPFLYLVIEYVETRQFILDQEELARRPAAVEQPAPAPQEQPEVYVPPEPVRYPLF